ncbi:hypothetical protein GOBAR_AA14412 [Gossypium barbadense]|uniref:Sphingoid long-chain bases kinase 1 n=1 Tax=Gossypium barbadense TaxID=3634 RepID=A0A2P5XSB1_GOSBA|nr:hypothetical protein GOBAR_AA14412 [Gossypium barbadense]
MLVLNGLLSRDNQKEGISIPIGIIPAGGLTAIDVFDIEWIQTGLIHFGMTVSYYGFVGDVEYLTVAKEDREGKISTDRDVVDMSDLYTDIMRRSNADGIPRASSLSSIDSIMTPSRTSVGEMDTCSSTHASTEPSEYVRGLDPKAKRLSFGRNNVTAELEVIHPQLPPSTTPNWRRTRSKSRTDKGWSGSTAAHDPSRCPIWDAEPKWGTEANWDVENPIELPAPRNDLESVAKKEPTPRVEDEWIVTKGPFLGILVCNHAYRTVQSSQMGKHLSLPYVEYVKVKSVKIKAGKHTHNGCGIDGEFFPLNGEVVSSLLPEQYRLIGHFCGHHDV